MKNIVLNVCLFGLGIGIGVYFTSKQDSVDKKRSKPLVTKEAKAEALLSMPIVIQESDKASDHAGQELNLEKVSFPVLQKIYFARQNEFEHKYLDQYVQNPTSPTERAAYLARIHSTLKDKTKLKSTWWEGRFDWDIVQGKTIPVQYFLQLYDAKDINSVNKNLARTDYKDICWIIFGYFFIEDKWRSESNSGCVDSLKIVDRSLYILHYTLNDDFLLKYIGYVLMPYPGFENSDARLFSMEDEQWVNDLRVKWRESSEQSFIKFSDKAKQESAPN